MKKLCEKCKDVEHVWELCNDCLYLICHNCPYNYDDCDKPGDYTCLECWKDYTKEVN